MSFSRAFRSALLKPNGLTAARTGLNRIASDAVRFYSPVRSRVHMPPPPRVGRRRARQQQQTEQQSQAQEYYEPEVTYSYPELNTTAPPTGGVIQYSDGIADILSQPVLVMERQIEYMNVFLVRVLQNPRT